MNRSAKDPSMGITPPPPLIHPPLTIPSPHSSTSNCQSNTTSSSHPSFLQLPKHVPRKTSHPPPLPPKHVSRRTSLLPPLPPSLKTKSPVTTMPHKENHIPTPSTHSMSGKLVKQSFSKPHHSSSPHDTQPFYICSDNQIVQLPVEVETYIMEGSKAELIKHVAWLRALLSDSGTKQNRLQFEVCKLKAQIVSMNSGKLVVDQASQIDMLQRKINELQVELAANKCNIQLAGVNPAHHFSISVANTQIPLSPMSPTIHSSLATSYQAPAPPSHPSPSQCHELFPQPYLQNPSSVHTRDPQARDAPIIHISISISNLPAHPPNHSISFNCQDPLFSCKSIPTTYPNLLPTSAQITSNSISKNIAMSDPYSAKDALKVNFNKPITSYPPSPHDIEHVIPRSNTWYDIIRFGP